MRERAFKTICLPSSFECGVLLSFESSEMWYEFCRGQVNSFLNFPTVPFIFGGNSNLSTIVRQIIKLLTNSCGSKDVLQAALTK